MVSAGGQKDKNILFPLTDSSDGGQDSFSEGTLKCGMLREGAFPALSLSRIKQVPYKH